MGSRVWQVAVRPQAHGLGRVAHEQEHRRHYDDNERDTQDRPRIAPADDRNKEGGYGHHDGRAHTVEPGYDAQRAATHADEPFGNRGGGDQRANLRYTQAGGQHVDDVELPQIRHVAQQDVGDARDYRAHQHNRPRAVLIDDGPNDGRDD